MTKHMKRLAIEKSWPLPRKGTKYLMKQYPGKRKEIAMPLAIVIRDILKVASTKREVRELLKAGDIIVDGKVCKEEKFPLSIFDNLSIPKIKKNYRITLTENGKICAEEISEKDAHLKICKIIGKKMLKNKVQQINCFDGRNFISKEKMNVNDSIIFDLKENKIVKMMPLKNGSDVFIMGGAHIGHKGKITSVEPKIKVKIKDNEFETQEDKVYVI